MRVDVYSRHGAFLTTIAGRQLLSAIHTDELNGEDSLAIQTTYPLAEGMRLVWCDTTGAAHEHICQDPKASRTTELVYSDTALNSICETFYDYIEDKRPYSYTFSHALQIALEPTRWTCGAVDQTGVVSNGLTYYHTSAREAINEILECGGELETFITVGTTGVTSRSVGIRKHRGATGGHRRFAYGKDLTSITRTEHWSAITACYGYGKGVETDKGGYGRKLTFADINGGRAYLVDTQALAKYGRPGASGLNHLFGEYENSECEDAWQLMDETRAYLNAHKEPGVTYEASIIDLVAMGRDWEGVGVGDDVQIVDSSFSPTLRCEGRVTKMVTDLLGGTATVTLGNVRETLADMWISQQQTVERLSQHASSWDVAATTPGAYLQQIIDGLNAQFNAAGMSYCFTSFETGTIWSSVPLDDKGRPKRGGGSAIQINSQGFRIASGTSSDGSYKWRTFGTGKGFTADELTVGTIKGGSNQWNLGTGDLTFNQGSIRSRNGQSFWDLTNNRITTQGMTANDIQARGTFECGGTFGIKLNSVGQLAGYRDGQQVGYINYSAESYDVSNPSLRYRGVQIQGGQMRISTPVISTSNSSDIFVTTTYGFTGSSSFISNIEDLGNGSIRWWTTEAKYINGICTTA